MYKNKQIILSSFLILVISGSIFAEDLSRPVVIATNVRPSPETEESDLGEVIQSAVILQLKLDGFETRVIEPVDFPPPKKEQDILLVSLYDIDGDKLAITITAYLSGDRKEEPIASGIWTGPLSLTLDKEIQNIIKNDIVPALPREIDVTMKETEKAAESGEAWAVAIIAAIAADTDRDASDSGKSRRPWRVGLGGNIYIPMSSAATFSNLGYGGQLTVGYAFKVGQIELVPALVTGGMWFIAEGTTRAQTVFVPLGAELRLSSILDSPLLPYVRIAGGGGWLLLLPENSSSLSKIIPYIEVGIGTDIKFSPIFGLYVDLGVRFLFEGSVTITHITPGLGAALRF